MGHAGVTALAGGGLAVVWFNQLRTMGVGILTPLGNRIAAVHAADRLTDHERTNRIRHLSLLGLLMATAAGIVGALLLILIGYALPHLGQPPAVADVALSVIIALAPGMIPCLWFQAIRQFTVGMEKPTSLLGITLASVAVNLFLDLALADGWGPLPALGAVGVGIATTLVHACTAIALAFMVRRDGHLRGYFAINPFSADDGIPPARDLREQLRLGIPVAATYGAEAGMFSVIALAMGSFGAAALAAHNVAYQVTFIVFQVGVGFSHGGSILVSRFHAQNQPHLARAAGLRAAGTMAVIVAAAGALFILAPEKIMYPFLPDADARTIGICSSLLAIGALMEFADTGQNLGIGMLRGLGDTVTGLKASLLGYWVIGLPVALLLGFPAGWGPAGIWTGLTIGLAVAATLLWLTFTFKTRQSSFPT